MTKSTSFVFAPLAFALTLSMTALPAAAQDSAPGTASDGERPSAWQHFAERYDADGDGVVSQEEFQSAHAERRFARIDANGDGQVTEDEITGLEGRFKARRHGQRAARGGGLIKAADADQSGSVTAEEWQQFTAALDGDGDGAISQDELRTYHEVRAGEGFKSRGSRGSRGGGPMGQFDADKSGTIDAAEQQALFERLDANSDGEVSADEMPRGRHGRRGPRGGGPAGALMSQADGDQDGQLTSDEWQGFLSSLDADANGTLSLEELAAIRPEGAPSPPAGAPSIEVSRLEEAFSRIDANGDGVITEDERPRRRFRGPRGR